MKVRDLMPYFLLWLYTRYKHAILFILVCISGISAVVGLPYLVHIYPQVENYLAIVG